MYCYDNACKVKPDQVTDNAYAHLSSDRNIIIFATHTNLISVTKRHIILFIYKNS